MPIRRKDPACVLTWKNDAELDRLTALNEKLNQGATKHSLRRDADLKQQEVEALKERLQQYDGYIRNDTDLLECVQVLFRGKDSARFTPAQARERLNGSPFSAGNWRELERKIENTKASRQYVAESLNKAEAELRAAIDLLETCDQVLGGSFLQTMAQKELQRRNAETGAVPNGQADAETELIKTRIHRLTRRIYRM